MVQMPLNLSKIHAETRKILKFQKGFRIRRRKRIIFNNTIIERSSVGTEDLNKLTKHLIHQYCLSLYLRGVFSYINLLSMKELFNNLSRKWTINRLIVIMTIALLWHFRLFCEILTSDCLDDGISSTASYVTIKCRECKHYFTQRLDTQSFIWLFAISMSIYNIFVLFGIMKYLDMNFDPPLRVRT